MMGNERLNMRVGNVLHRMAAVVLALLMFCCILPALNVAEAAEAADTGSTEAEALEVQSTENSDTTDSATVRTIGILFDNSGSMYKHSDWCRAIYAMEAFAAMANEGDRILIYPMHAITVGVVTDDEIEEGKVKYYTSTEPLEIICGDEESIAQIREIYTPEPGETPIESLEGAYANLMEQEGEKWFLILTDGYEFDRDGKTISNGKEELSELLSGFNENVNLMYLGIGTTAIEPELTVNDTYAGGVTIAADSAEVLADMISICDIVYGRSNVEVSEDTIDLVEEYSDITILVQGADVTGAALAGSDGEMPEGLISYTLSYSTSGQGKTKKYYEDMSSDTDLGGVLLTCENVPAGTYTITYDGSPDDISVSYVESAEIITDNNAAQENSEDLTESQAEDDTEIAGAISEDDMAVAASQSPEDTQLESTELGDAQSTKDQTPGELEDASDGDGLFTNGRWVVLGVVVALIAFAVAWGVMHQRIFPERITTDQTYYTVDGEEMAGEVTIEGGKELSGKTAQITVRAPEVPGRPDLEFGI
ncbi:MAG: hypothetical protein LIO37_01385, partial [Clostridiales bacterium]|nr:hypothetical protein [Clostridiales bacterium]